MAHQADGIHGSGLQDVIARSVNDGARGRKRVSGHRPGHGHNSTTASFLPNARQPVARHANEKSVATDLPSQARITAPKVAKGGTQGEFGRGGSKNAADATLAGLYQTGNLGPGK